MRRLIMKIVCMVVLLIPTNCFAGLHDYPNIAVLDFTNKAAVSSQLTLQDAALVTEFVIEELIDSDRFSVMEREQLRAICDEHSLNATGLVDMSTATQIGKLNGVKYFVYGSVVGLSLKEGVVSYGSDNIGVGNNKHKVIANITARIIDVETGRIVLSGRGEGASTSSNIDVNLDKEKYDEYSTEGAYKHTIKIGTSEVSQVQVHNALSKAAYDVVYGDYGLLAKMDGKAKKRKR